MKYLLILILFVSTLFSNTNNQSLFTQEELQWIKNNPTVKVGVDANWPPFEYINENLVES